MKHEFVGWLCFGFVFESSVLKSKLDYDHYV